jgi:hypothetical protein
MHACKASTELKSMDAIVSVCARCVLRKQTEPGWHHACMVQRKTQLLWGRRFDPALMRPAPRPSPTPSSCATVGKQKRSTEFPFPVSLTSFFGLFLAITGKRSTEAFAAKASVPGSSHAGEFTRAARKPARAHPPFSVDRGHARKHAAAHGFSHLHCGKWHPEPLAIWRFGGIPAQEDHSSSSLCRATRGVRTHRPHLLLSIVRMLPNSLNRRNACNFYTSGNGCLPLEFQAER